MHVLVIPSWYPSPENPIAGIFFRDSVKALKARIDRVGVLYSNSYSLLRGVRVPRLRATVDDGIPTYALDTINFLPKIPYGHSALYRANGRRLFKRYVAEQGRPTLIHAHACLYGGCLAHTLAQRCGIPYVVTEHSSDYARRVLPAWKLKIARKVADHAAAVVAVSPWLGDVLKETLAIGSERLHWIPNLVQADFFEVPLGVVPEKPFRFISVGVLDAKKGHHDLLEAFSLRFRETETHLVIIGSGRLDAMLRRRARELGIAPQVQFLGQCTRARVRQEIARSHALVLPSHQETFGVVLVEALALGIPVVATMSGGPECIVTAENGRLVPAGDPAQLADGMHHLRSEIARYSKESIRRDCRARFGEAAVTARTMALYEQALS